ncbi:MAG: helix-hairpin-helix domain-containing protein [Pseudomonadota bacterium]
MASSSKTFPVPLGDPSKWLKLAQEQQTDNLQTGMALVVCREPVALMTLQQAFVQRAMKRWGMAGVSDQMAALAQATSAAKSASAAAPKPAKAPAPAKVAAPAAAPTPPKAPPVKEAKPAVKLVPTPVAAVPDDLTVIKGIGPKFAATLAEHGITTYAKLAQLSAREIEDLEEKLGFSGRFARENWVEQAKALATH